MMALCVFAACLLVFVGAVVADESSFEPVCPVNTFSIVAYDTATGEFGAAVQSHWFKVFDVIWVEAGVGAVATQSLAEFSYGPLGLDLMKLGKSPELALKGLLDADPDHAFRQVAMINKNSAAVYTGDKCIAYAGDKSSRHYSVQANLMRDSTVWGAMAKAYETTKGDLADRMMAALEAAQAEGGDIRGKQSAAMVVVTGNPTGVPYKDRIIDIRVDDSPEPLVELKRLLNLSRAYDYMNQGDEAMAKHDMTAAQEAYGKAAELAPGNLEIMFWHAVGLVNVGDVENALPIFQHVFDEDESWRILVPRLAEVGQLPDDKKVIDEITSQ
jgi:uncharacterized Ntn-hydrolase superfamily protein